MEFFIFLTDFTALRLFVTDLEGMADWLLYKRTVDTIIPLSILLFWRFDVERF